MEWFIKAFKQYADSRGRARRKEYWMFGLFNGLIFMALGLVAVIFSQLGGFEIIGLYAMLFLFGTYFLVIMIPSLAVTVRRLHDTGKSGWFILLQFIPYLGGLILFIFMCIDSEYGENKWGPNPKGFGNRSDIEEIGKNNEW